ncbi:hypothetical protein QA649_36465 [Bradyrhizobium sp. CB1717]|uniref:hypothetical protein n=1 Tax=Bradyrhizobium sp. CB1717 TaxID=3039154 RepID=UPI0024B16314|nr:hypothetical protein [Bradyrhizobium sp. CB1717]WFU23471.1 hypothetical protein QA649_36465 [Bradyrhizobium sp. CB1717]
MIASHAWKKTRAQYRMSAPRLGLILPLEILWSGILWTELAYARQDNSIPLRIVVEDPAKLAVSRDPWARAIANNADALHTYTVPKPTVWTTDGVLSSIGLGMNAEDQDNIDEDVDLMCSLGRTPARETDRLFLGGNLESYRTASEANPYNRESNE